MSTQGARQVRLDVGDPDAQLAEQWANYRLLRKSFVSATALASFHHCHVKPFLERIVEAAGLRTQSWAMRQGLLAHEAVQSAFAAAAGPSRRPLREAFQAGAFAFAIEYPLKDERQLLRGIADLLFTAGGGLHIVELKNARPPEAVREPWGVRAFAEHALQLDLYGVLARREFGVAPRLTLVYLAGGRRDELLQQLTESGDAERTLRALAEQHPTWDLTPANEALVRDELHQMRRLEKRFTLPAANHGDATKCGRCTVRTWCPRRLDRPGDFHHLAPRLLVPE